MQNSVYVVMLSMELEKGWEVAVLFTVVWVLTKSKMGPNKSLQGPYWASGQVPENPVNKIKRDRTSWCVDLSLTPRDKL